MRATVNGPAGLLKETDFGQVPSVSNGEMNDMLVSSIVYNLETNQLSQK